MCTSTPSSLWTLFWYLLCLFESSTLNSIPFGLVYFSSSKGYDFALVPRWSLERQNSLVEGAGPIFHFMWAGCILSSTRWDLVGLWHRSFLTQCWFSFSNPSALILCWPALFILENAGYVNSRSTCDLKGSQGVYRECVQGVLVAEEVSAWTGMICTDSDCVQILLVTFSCTTFRKSSIWTLVSSTKTGVLII